MAGGSGSKSPTRLASMSVSTSAQGLVIPKLWGTTRVKTNLLWYGHFTSTAVSEGGGKGGSSAKSYNYNAAIILGLCEGPVVGLLTIWDDKSIYTSSPVQEQDIVADGGTVSALSSSGLTFFNGAVGQSTWGWLATNAPSQAIGYSGVAYLCASSYALDSSATVPNISAELQGEFIVSGSSDADPSLIINDFLTNYKDGVPGWGSGLIGNLTPYQQASLAQNLLVSPCIDTQTQASQFMDDLMTATNAYCFWSEGLFKVTPLCDQACTANGVTYTPNLTPIYSLNDDNFIPDSEGDPPVQVEIIDQSDTNNIVQLEYYDRTNQYNATIASAQDNGNIALYGRNMSSPVSLHMICDGGIATTVANIMLQRSLYIRCHYKFNLDKSFALLEQTDIVEITDAGLGLTNYPVRIIEIEDDDGVRKVTAEDLLVGVSSAPLYTYQNTTPYITNQSIDPGGVEANLALWSGDQTNAVYNKNACSITGAAAGDQYGGTTACALVPDTTNAEHFIDQIVSGFPGLNYTFSVCLQQGAHHIADVQIGDGSGNLASVTVDLNAGTIYSPAGVFGNAVLTSAAIEPTLVAGIYQVTLTASFPTATSLVSAVVAMSDTAAGVWAGDNSNAIYISQWAFRQGVAAGEYAKTTSAVAGPVLFNPPSVLTSQPAVWAAAAGGPDWGGANVWISTDNENYQNVGTIGQACVFGQLTTSLASHADPDTTDSFGVDLGASAGTLSSASQSTADNGGTMCLVDSELVNYEVATLTNPGQYTLGTYLRRGYLNSGIAAHSAGARFVRLNNSIFELPYNAANVGKTIYVKFQSFNAWGGGLQSLANCNVYTISPTQTASTAPVASNWTCTGTTLSNNGTQTPCIQITGACENPSATAIQFYEKAHGASTWSAAGTQPPNATTVDLTGVASGASCDIGIAYVINGVPTAITTIGSAVIAGTAYMLTGLNLGSSAYGILGDTAIITALGTAGAITGQGPLATSTLTTSQVNNALVAAGSGNRVYFSQFEKGTYGWFAAGSTTPTLSTFVSGAVTYINVNATATASGQYYSVQDYNQTFPVTAGETLAVSALLGMANGEPATAGLFIAFFNSSGGVVSEPAIGSAVTPSGGANYVSGTVVVPSGAVTAEILAQANTTGAGSISLFMAQPMVIGVAAGQTAIPAFTPGPSNVPAADVTAANTAAAISGQSPWATYSAYTPAQVNYPGANLVPNAGFYFGALDWTNLTSAVIGQAGPNGQPYCAMTTPGTISYASPNIPVAAGEPYSFQAYLYAAGLSAGYTRAYLSWFNSSGTTVGTATALNLIAGQSWTLVTAPNLTAPTGAAYCTINLQTVNAAYTAVGATFLTGGVAAWAQIKLELGATCTPFNDAASTSALYSNGASLDSLKPAQINADQTSLNTAAALYGQGPLATSTLTAAQVNNSLIPLPGVNRVPFSLMEKGNEGWNYFYNPSALAYSQGPGTNVTPYMSFTATYTAVGQTLAWKTNSFYVTAGETLYIGGQGASNSVTLTMSICFFNSSGGLVSQIGTYTLAASSGVWTTFIPDFITVPAGAVTAYYQFQTVSTASGTQSAYVTLPMVCGALAGQTVAPGFNPGPNSESGADITANYTAAGIVGQAAIATDPTAQIGSTNNATYEGSTDPATLYTVVDGAFWFDNTNGVFYMRKSGAWAAVGGQITDGTLLFSSTAGVGSNTAQGATASGVYTVPGNAPGYVTVTIEGGGGGNGWSSSNNEAGGAGGTCSFHFAVTPGSTTITWSIGGQGQWAVSSTGASGTNSTVTSSAFTGTMTGYGGSGGGHTTQGAGGTATGPSGSVNTTGGTGGSGPGYISIVAHTS